MISFGSSMAAETRFLYFLLEWVILMLFEIAGLACPDPGIYICSFPAKDGSSNCCD